MAVTIEKRSYSVKNNHFLPLSRLFILAVFMLGPTPASAATYYVAVNGNDSNSGTIESPWQTISYAMSSKSSVSAGDTVLVRAGIYRESVYFGKNGTEGSRITIKAYPNETVVMDGSTILSNGWTQCVSNEPGLTVLGVTNANYANIYKTIIPDSLLATYPLLLGSEPLVFDGDTRKKLASQPTQTNAWGTDVTEFEPLEEEAWGQDAYLIDSSYLTQADDYWNGGYIDVKVYLANTAVIRREIADFVQADNKIIFDEVLPQNISGDGSIPDSYIIVNHPHVIDAADEYLLFDNKDDTWTMYLYSTTLPVDISIVYLPRAFLSRTYGSYISIEGITIRNYGFGFDLDAPVDTFHESFNITNCTIINTTGGIYMYDFNNSTVDNCTISYTNTGGRGVLVVNGTGNCVKNCTISNTSSTNIGFVTTTKSSITNNTLYGIIGLHGNAISCYTNCSNTLIANNIIYRSNLALKTMSGLMVYGNCFLNDNTTTDVIGFMGGSSNTGDFYYFYNTILGSSANMSMDVRTTTDGDIYIINNIIDGMDGSTISTYILKYNLYVELSWNQEPWRGWFLGEGEICPLFDPPDYETPSGLTFDDIFVNLDYENVISSDASLTEGSPAIGAGTDISAYLTQARIDFPNFNFDVDILGNPRDANPDVGCYEYVWPDTGSPKLYGDVSENGEISATDASMAARYSVDLISLTASQITAADVTGNGSVSATDASWIARRAVDAQIVFPVEE